MKRTSLVAAIAAAASLGVGVAPQPATSGPQTPAPREYVRTEKRTRRAKRQHVKHRHRGKHRAEATASQPWKKFKGGWMTDGRGDIRSPKRLFRRAVEREFEPRFGKLSGRQWVRARKAIRRAQKERAQ